MTCLCKFDNSTLSLSIIVIFPMPAAAKYISRGLPRPPIPITKTLDCKSLYWPSPPISGSIIFLEYLSISLSDNCI